MAEAATATIVMFCTSDLAGQTRGKGVPAAHLKARLDRGIAWTPTNSMITAFGEIAPGPWGPFGDVLLMPDPKARFDVVLDGAVAETVYLSDIETPAGAPWPACPRGFAKRMLDLLEARHGLRLNVAFEQEFALDDGQAARPNRSYALGAVRQRRAFAERLMAALDAADCKPEAFMAEFGPNQYEVVVAPATGVAAADRAVAVREIARAVALSLDARANFTPLVDPDGVGNGVHVHFSLYDVAARAQANFDPGEPNGVDRRAGAFLAGVLARLPALLALTAPSLISYLRLTPNRWSATHNNLGVQDREAALRICPTFQRHPRPRDEQFHFEFRAADAAASPYLVLGALAAAGLLGLDDDLPSPRPLDGAPATASAEALEAAGVTALPQSLTEALDNLEGDAALTGLLGDDLVTAYLAHKHFEADLLAGLDPAALCARYGDVY